MKYAVLLLALMFAGCEGGESSNDGGYDGGMGKEIEESSNDGGYETFTYEGETMQVAKEDFPNAMNWDNAMTACKNLGNGWRLPSKEELEEMYSQLHKQGKGNFQEAWYWSSSQVNPDHAWAMNFVNGVVHSNDKSFNYQVRAVRALP